MPRKPKVETRCPANAHPGPHERTVEFSDHTDNTYAGGLINLMRHEDGRLTVDVYNCSDNVEVRIGVQTRYRMPLDGVLVGTSPQRDPSDARFRKRPDHDNIVTVLARSFTPLELQEALVRASAAG